MVIFLIGGRLGSAQVTQAAKFAMYCAQLRQLHSEPASVRARTGLESGHVTVFKNIQGGLLLLPFHRA
jgi:hypothetical protein